MKALTVRQPWASLIVVGAKSIETRSWSTTYRGPLIIHAGKGEPKEHDRVGKFICTQSIPHTWWLRDTEQYPKGWPDCPLEHYMRLPIGAVVASCQLIDVVPIIGQHEEAESFSGPYVSVTGDSAFLWQDYDEEPHTETLADFMGQVPFGDFTPGRYAWLLEDVKPTTERCPACWGDGAVEVPGHYGATAPCKVCGTGLVRGACDPIPAKGRQGLWTWEPVLVSSSPTDTQ